MRRYRSPQLLAPATLPDKFESTLAVDMCMAVLRTFAESQQMAAQSLVNFYLHEELADHVTEVILHALFSLLLTYEKPFNDITPLYLAILLNTIVNVSRDNNDKLKKLRANIEEKFAKHVFAKVDGFSQR